LKSNQPENQTEIAHNEVIDVTQEHHEIMQAIGHDTRTYGGQEHDEIMQEIEDM
jgi:hypothetical protein